MFGDKNRREREGNSMATTGGDEAILAIGAIIIAVMANILIYAMKYKKVPPNKAMVVFGRKQMRTRKGYQIIIGGAKFILPILEEIAFLSLEARPLKIALNKVRVDTRNEKAVIALKANSVIRITSDPRILEVAAVNLLEKSDKEINEIATNIIEGPVRNVCSHTTLDEIRNNFPQVSSTISETANENLNKVGLEMVSFNIVDVQ
jgi:flotillin